MPDIDIMRSQKNEVLQAIKDRELDHFNFDWIEVDSLFNRDMSVPCLCYKDTEFFFIFDMQKDYHYAIFSPGEEIISDEVITGTWKIQLAYVRNWLNYLKRELNEPDLWEQLSQFQLRGAVSPAPDVENLPFTVQEVKQITTSMNKMREYLETEFDGIEADHKLINEKMDYLIDAASRQGRKDWIHTCIGVIATLATALGLTPEQGEIIFALLRDAVRGIVKLLSQ